MTRFYISSILVCILFTSCNKFLDVKPKGRLIPTEINDFNHLLDNTDIVNFQFLDNNNGCILGYMTDNAELSEGQAKILYKANNHPNIDRYYGYAFRMPYQNPGYLNYFWDWGIYRSAKYFNNVIEGINGIKTTANAQDANPVLAQAYTGRAWSYFNGALVFGPVYKPGGDNSTKVLPYITSSNPGDPVPGLSTQEEIFTKVLADLHAALPYSPPVTNYPSRPNKAATQAMLAYVHLFTQKYDSVVYYANLAWTAAIATGGVDKVLYDYNTFSLTAPATPLTSPIKSPDNQVQLVSSKEMLLYRSPDNGAGRSFGCYPSAEFIALFDQDNDLRFKYFLLTGPGYKTTFNSVVYDDGNRVQYYRGSAATSGIKTQMTGGFTYPELLLMRAEGYARTNKLAEAMTDLNTLRRYRYKTGTPDLTMPGSQDEVISLVLQERRRELPLGHLKRFMDLKRFCLEPAKPWGKTKIVHQVGTETYEGVIDSPTFILPKSNVVLAFNPQWNIPLDNRPFN